ncbi:MAG: aldo/keto reductase [Acidobacteria bacterium]|nr:aldo/keto reductase [Acidobacteriota bacterium]
MRRRRVFVGSAFAGLGINGLFAKPPKVKAGDVPTRVFGKTGIKLTVLAQGGSRMDLHPDLESARKFVRHVYDLGINYFDCAHAYWDGRAEEAYGGVLPEFRKQVFITTKSGKRTRADAEKELEISLKRLHTDYLDLWQMHDVRTQQEMDRIFGPNGAIEAFEAAKKAGKCRYIGFTGHFDPEIHVAMLKRYDKWDSVLMPLHAAETSYLSFEEGTLPLARERGIGIQAIKVFGKGYLLRAISPAECLRYVLNLNVHAVAGCGTQGQMEDNIRVAKEFKPLAAEEVAAIRQKAITGRGVLHGSEMEYWKKGFFKP